MRNATYLGLCLLAANFGLVAVALGQQSAAAPGAQPGQQPAGQIDSQNQQSGTGDTLFDRQSPGEPSAFRPGSGNGIENFNNQPGTAGAQRTMTAPGAPLERSMIPGTQQEAGNSQITGAGQQRGELGVWLVENGGPGVEITRITEDSAAKQAGLRAGDIILQVNGRGASSPEATARMIRQIPIGQTAMLTIWRDGDQQQMQVAMQPAREVHQVAFRDESGSANGDLASRTMRLEQQLGTVMQELQQMRQEVAQLRGAHGESTGIGADPNQGTNQQGTPPSQPADPLAPPPGFERPDQKGAQPQDSPPADAGAPASTPDGQNATKADPFGNDTAPKAEEAPKAGAESKTDADSDSLFK